MIELVCWILAILIGVISSIIIGMHIKVVIDLEEEEENTGLMPVHVVVVAITMTGFGLICAALIKSIGVPFVLFCSCCGLTYLAFGILINHLRKRLVYEK